MDTGIINTFLIKFDTLISNGFGLISGDVNFLISFVIVLSITLAGLYWALSDNGDVLAPFLRKVLVIGFFAFLVNQWEPITQTIMASFVDLGLKAGGDGITQAVFFDPGKLAHKGIEIYLKLIKRSNELSGPIGFFEHFGEITALNLTALACVAAFFILAIQVFVTIIEFKLVTLASFVLLPFGIWNKTSFMTERALGYVVSAGLKFMILAIVVSVGYAVFNQLLPTGEPHVQDAFAITLGAFVIVALSLLAPSLGMSIISGGPSLGAGAAVTTGAALVGAGAVGAGVGSAGGRAAAGAGKLGVGATRAAAGLATGGASAAAGGASSIAGRLAGGGASAVSKGASSATSGASSAASGAAKSASGGAGKLSTATGGAKAAGGAAQSAGSSAAGAGQSTASAGAGAGKSGPTAAGSASNTANTQRDPKLPAGSKFQRVQQAASSMQGGDDSGGISATGGTTDED